MNASEWVQRWVIDSGGNQSIEDLLVKLKEIDQMIEVEGNLTAKYEEIKAHSAPFEP